MPQNREMKMEFVDSQQQEGKEKRRRKTKKQREIEAALMEATASKPVAEETPPVENESMKENAADFSAVQNLLQSSIDEIARSPIIIDNGQIVAEGAEPVSNLAEIDSIAESPEVAKTAESAGMVSKSAESENTDRATESLSSSESRQENPEPSTVNFEMSESKKGDNVQEAQFEDNAGKGDEAAPQAPLEVKECAPAISAASEIVEEIVQEERSGKKDEKKPIRILGIVINKPISLRMPEWMSGFLHVAGQKLATPMSIILLATMIAAIVVFVRNQYVTAKHTLEAGPEKAYALAEEGNAEGAKQIWIQINSKTFWYQPFSGFFTSIDEPYLQKASVAYKAEDWQKVAENAYKALQVPITDQQAVYVQQMILQATANMVKAYLPNQAEQPIRGGVPDHALPVCEPSATYIWVVPAILILMAGAFLYSRKRVMFAIMALLMPCYFWFVNMNNTAATQTCELRLSFNPEHITLYGEPTVPLPPFTPTPLRVESVPLDKASKAASQVKPASETSAAATIPKTEFGTTESPLKIEQGNAPVQPVQAKK